MCFTSARPQNSIQEPFGESGTVDGICKHECRDFWQAQGSVSLRCDAAILKRNLTSARRSSTGSSSGPPRS